MYGPAGDLTVPFVLHDDGPDREDRIIMFGTTASIGLLTTTPQIRADGTFSVTPFPFRQLYVIHAEDSQKLFPAIFVLLRGKTRAMYNQMLQIIMTLCPNISATEVMTDFEYQAMRSFEANLRIDLHGCFFHLTQAIPKKFGSRRSAQANANDPNNPLIPLIPLNPVLKQHYIMLRALAIVPSADIPSAFDAIVWNITQQNILAVFNDVIEYMRTTWIRPPRGVLGLGSFPPAQWSIYSATLLNEPRTNNRVEGWHLKLNMFLKVTHPGIYCINSIMISRNSFAW